MEGNTISTSTHCLLDTPELASQLGVSMATIYRWRSEGHDMPQGFKIGGAVRWTQEVVDAWIVAQMNVNA